MSWQDDLRRLDADLAAGRLEPAVHRKQRDELLAQASGSTVPSPVPSPLRRPGGNTWHSANPAYGQPEQPPHRVQAPQPRSEMPPGNPARPAPPPYRQAAQQTPPPPATGKTLSGGHPPVPDYLTTAPSPADINPTRYLRVDGPAAYRPQASRFPPLGPSQPGPTPPLEAEPGKHRWDDVGGTAGPSRGKPTWLFLSLGVLVVIAMIVGTTLWLGKDGSSTQANNPAVTPSVPAGAIGSLEERLPSLPGTAHPQNSTMSLAKGQQLGLYPQQTTDLLTANGATDVTFRSSVDGGVNYLVLIFRTSTPATAQTVVEALYQKALSGGFSKVQADVRTVSGNDGTTFWNTTWYGSGSTVVLTGISEPFNGQAGLTSRQDNEVKALEQVLPAG